MSRKDSNALLCFTSLFIYNDDLLHDCVVAVAVAVVSYNRKEIKKLTKNVLI